MSSIAERDRDVTDGQVVGKSTVAGDVTAKLIASRDGGLPRGGS